MNLSKRPIVLYDGLLSQLKDENIVGQDKRKIWKITHSL